MTEIGAFGDDRPLFDEGVLIPDPFAPSQVFPDPFPDWFEPGPSEWRTGQLDPMVDARALHYVESVQRWTGRDLFWATAYPIASVFVPTGQVGIGFAIQTHLIDTDGNEYNDGQRIDPWAWERKYLFPITYHLRLQVARPVTEASNVPISTWQASQGILPGTALTQLGSWQDQRYGWRAPAYPLRLEVPGGYWLRLWACIPTQPGQDPLPVAELGGRLRALVAHHRDNPAAQMFARGAW